jgi:hypothetical protein
LFPSAPSQLPVNNGVMITMGDIVSLNELVAPNMSQLELIPTLFSFFICVVMSFIVRDLYLRRSLSPSLKQKQIGR